MRDTSEEVTAAHAATLTGLSERTIRRKIASGEIPARHIARNRYAIHVRDLPIRQSPQDLFARLGAVENRVRLLELQYAYLAAQQAVSGVAPRVADAPSSESGQAAAPASPHGADPVECPRLLAELAHETQRLTP